MSNKSVLNILNEVDEKEVATLLNRFVSFVLSILKAYFSEEVIEVVTPVAVQVETEVAAPVAAPVVIEIEEVIEEVVAAPVARVIPRPVLKTKATPEVTPVAEVVKVKVEVVEVTAIVYVYGFSTTYVEAFENTTIVKEEEVVSTLVNKDDYVTLTEEEIDVLYHEMNDYTKQNNGFSIGYECANRKGVFVEETKMQKTMKEVLFVNKDVYGPKSFEEAVMFCQKEIANSSDPDLIASAEAFNSFSVQAQLFLVTGRPICPKNSSLAMIIHGNNRYFMMGSTESNPHYLWINKYVKLGELYSLSEVKKMFRHYIINNQTDYKARKGFASLTKRDFL